MEGALSEQHFRFALLFVQAASPHGVHQGIKPLAVGTAHHRKSKEVGFPEGQLFHPGGRCLDSLGF